MTTNVDLVNRALAQGGTRSQITSMTDGSTEALYANLLYNGLRDFMLREGDPDWAIQTANLVAAAVPIGPWIYSYTYPSDAIRIRNLIPLVSAVNDPQPIEFNVIGNRVIVTKIASAAAIYTSSGFVETLWDSLFTEGFVRLLSSALIFALESKIEASKAKLNEALSIAGIANLRDS